MNNTTAPVITFTATGVTSRDYATRHAAAFLQRLDDARNGRDSYTRADWHLGRIRKTWHMLRTQGQEIDLGGIQDGEVGLDMWARFARQILAA